MIFITDEVKNDPIERWNLPDEVFFAAGACHILAYAFLQKYADKNFKAIWIKPAKGYRGNHIFVTDGNTVFDFEGVSSYETYIEQIEAKLTSIFYQWNYELIEIDEHILISEQESKKIEGLWLRQPDQFLHNALPRANTYLQMFSAEIEKSMFAHSS
ncbi:MAG: hypothetical protein CL677_06075 [Bdellovibrionaceae bacterium]|nr:hypothetical protein [Pseudobdellovibrionaceae bacterium]